LQFTSTTTVSPNVNFYIGATNTLDGDFNGYIQDFRITNGVARTITTPTTAFAGR
jgi:hypothetical protein